MYKRNGKEEKDFFSHFIFLAFRGKRRSGYIMETLTIAIPDDGIYTPLIAKAEEVCKANGWRLLRGSETQCARWFSQHTAEVALVSPLCYARDSYQTDFRIIPVSVCALQGITYQGSMYIRPGADVLERAVSALPDDFLIQMGLSVLREKFDSDVHLSSVEQYPAENFFLPDEPIADVVLSYGFDDQQKIVLDISDEWYDYCGIPLIRSIWVCRSEEVPDNIAEQIQAMQEKLVLDEQHITEREINGVNAGREGKIIWAWDNTMQEALQKTIELLFFWQYTGAISAVKIWKHDEADVLFT